MTKPRWVLVPGVWWLDAKIDGVDKPALHVTELLAGVFEIHVVRGGSTGNFTTWRGSSYSSDGNPTATRLVADKIWDYITETFNVVAANSFSYNGLLAYSSQWPNRGQLGID